MPFQLASVQIVHRLFTMFPACVFPYRQEDPVFPDLRWAKPAVTQDLQGIPFAPKPMLLPGYIVRCSVPRLPLDPLDVLTDPVGLAFCEGPYHLIGYVAGRRDANLPQGGQHREMDILYILSYDFDFNIGNTHCSPYHSSN